MKRGIIFNIQKFSIHDGPGIRTTVFVKGCPLRCKWCSNPESQIKDIQLLYDKDICMHCLACVSVCSQKAISFDKEQIQIDHKKCIGCLQCVHHCPSKALTHEGEYRTIDDIVQLCLQDNDFYEESGGGVTISGGEGMYQPSFLTSFITQLKEHHLHIAIETTGYVQTEVFQEIAPMLDLLLFDVKHYDSKQHFEETGVHNELILRNLKWAINNNLDVLPRIPVIPEFNSSLEDANGLAQLLKNLGVKKVQLLPFHQFGEKKYEQLNRKYGFKDKKALHPEDLKEYQQVFLDKGLQCFF